MEAIQKGLTKAYHEKWHNEGKTEEKRDMVIALNEQNVSLDIIAKAAKISINKVKSIIARYKNRYER